MTNTQITVRKDIYRRLRRLPDSKATKVLEYIDSLEEYEPNEETVEVLRDIEAGRNLSKPYSNIKEMMKDMLTDAYIEG